MSEMNFPPMEPDSFLPVSMNFKGKLDGRTISAVDWLQIEVFRGTDPDAGARLYGTPSHDDTRLIHQIKDPVKGVTYKLRGRVTDSAGFKPVMVGYLTIED